MDIIELKNKKIPLYISDKLRNQIQYLCTMIPDVEWSGILFHDIEGNTDDIANVKLHAQEVLPMNMGTSGYTEYDYDEAYVKHLKSKVDNKMPEFIKLLKHTDKNRISHIHSHNKMGVFFSGTDVQELVDGTEGKNYYLSLIVNNAGDMCARVAYRGMLKSEGHITETVTFKDAFAKLITRKEKIDLTEEKEVLFFIECDIISEFDVDDTFCKRVDYIMEENKKKTKAFQDKWKTYQPKQVYDGNSSKFGQFESNRANALVKQLQMFPGTPIMTSDANVTDRDIKNFIAKVISLDVDCTFGIEALLTDLQLQINQKQIDMDEYADKLEQQILITYSHCFGDLGEGYELLSDICSRASDIIDTYEIQFPFVDIISHEFFTASTTEYFAEEELELATFIPHKKSK